MKYDPDLHHRRSIRWQHYDYSWSGVYFITLVVRRRLCLFGEIDAGQMRINDAGIMIISQWNALTERFSFCQIASFVMMPNHFHGLLIFHNAHQQEDKQETLNAPTGTAEKSLGRVTQAFKSLTTNAYIQNVRELHWPPFETRLWQRNYWERVVRDQNEWQRAHEYMENNPAHWLDDKHHPHNLP